MVRLLRISLFIFLIFLLSDISIYSQSCMPTVNSVIDVNGVVVGKIIGGGGGLPAGCGPDAGWAGVVGRDFTVFGVPGTHIAKIFFAGFNSDADGTLDKIYIGIHVENDPDLRNKDRLTLYFDANGDNTFDASDFAVYYEIGPTTTIINTEGCNSVPSLGEFYRFSGGNWVVQGSVPTDIVTNYSYDYDDSNDSETGIWEAEISIDVGGLGLTAPATGEGFKFGAKLFIHEIAGKDSWTVWKFPSGLTTDSNPLHSKPNHDTNVLPVNLEQPITGNCGDVVFWPDATTGVTATDAAGNSNKFTKYIDSDFNSDGSLSESKKNKFTARLKFINPSDPMDDSPVAVPNNGQVQFFIKPWNAGFLSTNLIGQSTLSFDHLSQELTTTLSWPQNKTQYNAVSGDIAVSNHLCLQVNLNGFTVNLNEAGDVSYRNLTYTSLSAIKDTFLISTVGVKLPEGGTEGIYNYILRMKWYNLPKDMKDGWKFNIDNAQDINLEDLGNNYYLLKLKIRQTQKIAISMSGGKMPFKTQNFTISPKAGGKILPTTSGEPSLTLKVDPGKMVTIIADGIINCDPINKEIGSNGPNGIPVRFLVENKFLLPKDYYIPWQNFGALIGSFDKFKTAFVIGADKTFLVPDKADTLYLAINDVDGKYDENTGEGFNLHVVITDPMFFPTRLTAIGNPKFGIPDLPQAGSNLPQLKIDVFQAFEMKGDSGMIKLLQPTGYVTYAVYDSHKEQNGGEPGPCACSPTSPMGMLISSLMLAFGLTFTGLYVRNKKNNNGLNRS